MLPEAPVTATLMVFFHVFVSSGLSCRRGAHQQASGQAHTTPPSQPRHVEHIPT